jgi:hypothetical protein
VCGLDIFIAGEVGGDTAEQVLGLAHIDDLAAVAHYVYARRLRSIFQEGDPLHTLIIIKKPLHFYRGR